MHWLLHFKKFSNFLFTMEMQLISLGKLLVKMSKKGQEKQVPDFHMDAIKEEESCLKCIDIGGNWESTGPEKERKEVRTFKFLGFTCFTNCIFVSFSFLFQHNQCQKVIIITILCFTSLKLLNLNQSHYIQNIYSLLIMLKTVFIYLSQIKKIRKYVNTSLPNLEI